MTLGEDDFSDSGIWLMGEGWYRGEVGGGEGSGVQMALG